jgi:hypothetical protein
LSLPAVTAEACVRGTFEYPGDGINGVFGAFNRADGEIESITRSDVLT